MKLVFYSQTPNTHTIEQFYDDMRAVAQEKDQESFLNQYIYGPKPYNKENPINFNHFGTRLVPGLNFKGYGIRLRGGSRYLTDPQTKQAFQTFLEEVKLAYGLDYVLVVEDEQNHFYLNLDPEGLFFESTEGCPKSTDSLS